MEFDKAKAYLSTLYEKLTSIEKISSRINKERQDLVHELNNFYPIFNIWALSEPHLAPYLKGIAHAIESSTLAQSNLIFSYSTSLGNPVKEFLIYVSVVQDTLKKREAYQCVYENSLTELTKRHTEKDQVIFIPMEIENILVNFCFKTNQRLPKFSNYASISLAIL